MQIIATRGDLRGSCNNAQNLLLQVAPPGDFEISTKVSFNPTANYQQGGLLIFVDNNNYIKVDALWNTSVQGGQNVEILQEQNGVFPSGWPRLSTNLSVPAFLKVSKSGNVYTGLYSADGQLWNAVGSVNAASTIVDPKVGLYAFTSTNCFGSAPDIAVDFDFFRVTTGKGYSFQDVPPSYWSWQYIERLYKAGITGGCSTSPLMYCPSALVTRDQMAVLLLKGKHASSYVPPAASGVFQDVPTNYWAAAWIEQLAAEGITAGCGSGNFCPTTAVTRDQMAVFLLKAKHGSSYVPPAATGVFQDVPTNYWAAAWIEQLAAEGVTAGCGGGNYCPATPVTRDQMAVFLVKTFNLP